LVQVTWSSQSAAEQQVPHVADALSARAQQFCPSLQNGECSHRLAEQASVVHGSPSSHWESSQHSAQPTPGQHSFAPAHLVAACSHSDAAQTSVVQGSPSLQSALTTQASLWRQSAVAEQYSIAAQLVLFGE
jgi:hypothetical protein